LLNCHGLYPFSTENEAYPFYQLYPFIIAKVYIFINNSLNKRKNIRYFYAHAKRIKKISKPLAFFTEI